LAVVVVALYVIAKFVPFTTLNVIGPVLGKLANSFIVTIKSADTPAPKFTASIVIEGLKSGAGGGAPFVKYVFVLKSVIPVIFVTRLPVTLPTVLVMLPAEAFFQLTVAGEDSMVDV
jgi:hypothetical protein